VAPHDEVLALEQLERLAQGHQRDAEGLRELSLVGERRARRQPVVADLLAQRFGDAVIPGDASAHATISDHFTAHLIRLTVSARTAISVRPSLPTAPGVLELFIATTAARSARARRKEPLGREVKRAATRLYFRLLVGVAQAVPNQRLTAP